MLTSAGGSTLVRLPPGLPLVSGQATTLRQILLNLLLAAAGVTPQPVVTIESNFDGRSIDLLFSTARGDSDLPRAADSGEFMTLARRLAELSGGSVEQLLPPAGMIFMARLSLPAIERIPVLFVDDNHDSLQLFERSLTATRFQFAGTRDPRRAIDLAVECSARIIVLDIMLPGIDGWEILGRLRAHPSLGNVPVIISTILPHEQLALSLGASAFLRKPVSREALLDLLDRLLNIKE
jgi:CheY-like chemotaxis protein